MGEAIGEVIEEAYSSGDVSIGIGAAFPVDDSLGPGFCADFQLRGYCLSDYIAWDMAYQHMQFRDKANGGHLTANMFVMGLGGASEVFVSSPASRPFRWGVAAVAAFPRYSHSRDLVIVENEPLYGMKLRFDWLPLTDWRGGWVSGILEFQALTGDAIGTASDAEMWEMPLVVVAKGGIQFCW
ncbi:MAG: hypothetical protein ACYTKD_30225 [Planctomycetota bacterium]|jgi:hypothetical protein